MDARNVLLTLHILFALVTIGWLVTHAVFMPATIRRGDVGGLRYTERVASKVGPLAIIVFLLGIALVAREGDDGIDFSDKWVIAAMVLFVVALVNGAVFIARTERRALERLEAGESAAEEARTATMLGGLNLLIVIAILYLMVAKPGGY